jgi:hypothetical protein
VMAQNRLQALDHMPAIQFERVRHVILAQPEQKPYKAVCNPVQNQLQKRIADYF